MIWTNFAKDKFLAPHVSALTECRARPLELVGGQPEKWLPGFVLNSMLRVSWTEPARQLAFMIVRRVDAAVREYEAGRAELEAFVDQGSQLGIQRYSRGLMHFETCVGATFQAWMLVRQLSTLSREVPEEEPKLFEEDDGTDIQRLNSLYNTSKHADERIVRGHFAPDSTLPIWIVNEGLAAVDCHLSFAELADLLKALARISHDLAYPPPGAA